jgi:spermidine/putrescine transport system substrate-binding protein
MSIRLPRRRFLGRSLAVAATLPALPGLLRAQGGQVNVFNWDTYIGPTTIRDFTDATGIAVRYDLYGSNDELFARMREGNPGYDLIFPSNDYVERMIAADMLEPIDHARIPNFEHIDPRFQDPIYDPGRAHSMPYFWGTAGLGYRTTVATPHRWADVLEADNYGGRVSLQSESSVIQVALKYLGYSVNTTLPAEIDEAAEVLIRAKRWIRTFAPDTGQDLLLAGEVDVAMEWNGDILQVMEEDPGLAYLVPEEGSLVWEDDMCIPKGGPNPEAAHELIDFILEPEVHGAIATYIKYACPNRSAFAHIPEEDLANPAIYPPDEVLDRCEISVYKGEAVERLYEDALTRVLAA